MPHEAHAPLGGVLLCAPTRERQEAQPSQVPVHCRALPGLQAWNLPAGEPPVSAPNPAHLYPGSLHHALGCLFSWGGVGVLNWLGGTHITVILCKRSCLPNMDPCHPRPIRRASWKAALTGVFVCVGPCLYILDMGEQLKGLRVCGFLCCRAVHAPTRMECTRGTCTRPSTARRCAQRRGTAAAKCASSRTKPGSCAHPRTCGLWRPR